MNYNKLLELIKDLRFEELREDQPEYLEFVIGKNHLNHLTSILENYYGAACAYPGKRPSQKAEILADPYGGIKNGQTLYHLDKGEVFYCALLWPWGNGQATTIKIFRGGKKTNEANEYAGATIDVDLD